MIGPFDRNAVALAAGAAALWFLPASLGAYGFYVVTLWLVTSLAAMGLNLTLGYAGLKSLGHAAFLGIGAYATALITASAGLPWPLAALASGLLCFALGLVLGFPALRVRAHYLGFVTLAFASLVFLVARNEQWLTGGVFGFSNIPRPTLLGTRLDDAQAFFRFTLSVTLLLGLAMWWLLRGPWGRAFMALRENPVRAASLGVDVRAYTLLAFAIGAAYAGVAGAIYAPLVEFIDPGPFALQASFMLLLMVVVGGQGYFLGPFLGALVGVALPEYLRFTGGYYLLVFAAGVLLLLIICPQGLIGLLERGGAALRRPRDARPTPAALAEGGREP
ncbi:MAG TPA: branched-chain amino acid ABC transporter permease [Salinarimonas sp.]|nr:branched-chain amino acid ABC transporter permease [Salinarimonas sp.]